MLLSVISGAHEHQHPPPRQHGGHDEHAAHAEHGGHDKHAGHDEHAGHDKHTGHDKHAGHSVAMFRDKFWISLLLTAPTLVWGHMLQNALGYSAPAFPGSHWIPALFGTAVFAYGGTPSLQGAGR